jgi:hypothetical protein
MPSLGLASDCGWITGKQEVGRDRYGETPIALSFLETVSALKSLARRRRARTYLPERRWWNTRARVRHADNASEHLGTSGGFQLRFKTADSDAAAAMRQFERSLQYAPNMHLSGVQKSQLM